jgi:hypothetical protein
MGFETKKLDALLLVPILAISALEAIEYPLLGAVCEKKSFKKPYFITKTT